MHFCAPQAFEERFGMLVPKQLHFGKCMAVLLADCLLVSLGIFFLVGLAGDVQNLFEHPAWSRRGHCSL
jgi:hypothetical protein